jgi:hypothetical protein
MKSVTFCMIFVLVATCCWAQAGQSAANQVGSTVIPAGTTITVHLTNIIDSSKPGNGQFAGVVKNAVTAGSFQIPAQSPALVKLIPSGTGNPRTWTLSLVSVTANGQTTLVNGSSPSFDVIGSVVGGATNTAVKTLGGALGGLGIKQPKAPPQPPAPVPAATGTRVYVPANSDVRFVVANATPPNQAGGASSGQQVSGGAATPAASGQTVPGQTQPTANQPAQTGQQQSAGSSTVVYENIQYTLQQCQKQAPHIICSFQITNLGGTDAKLGFGQGSYYIDQAGNRVNVSARSIANCAGFGWCQLLPGVAMAGKFEFTDEDGHATTLVRLQIEQNRKPVAQFTQVAIQ